MSLGVELPATLSPGCPKHGPGRTKPPSSRAHRAQKSTLSTGQAQSFYCAEGSRPTETGWTQAEPRPTESWPPRRHRTPPSSTTAGLECLLHILRYSTCPHIPQPAGGLPSVLDIPLPPSFFMPYRFFMRYPRLRADIFGLRLRADIFGVGLAPSDAAAAGPFPVVFACLCLLAYAWHA